MKDINRMTTRELYKAYFDTLSESSVNLLYDDFVNENDEYEFLSRSELDSTLFGSYEPLKIVRMFEKGNAKSTDDYFRIIDDDRIYSCRMQNLVEEKRKIFNDDVEYFMNLLIQKPHYYLGAEIANAYKLVKYLDADYEVDILEAEICERADDYDFFDEVDGLTREDIKNRALKNCDLLLNGVV